MQSLNIKDPEAHRLAREISRETGQTITRAVIDALREKLERVQRHSPDEMAAGLRAIATRAQAHIKRPYTDHADFLYDEHGLPK